MAGKAQNALKHGAFTAELILPGEDADAFQAMHEDLLAEWRPDGPTERDVVTTLASHMWRKRRINIYRRDRDARAKLQRAIRLSGDYALAEKGVRDGLEFLVHAAEEDRTPDALADHLPEICVEYLAAVAPFHKFNTGADWAFAAASELAHVVLHMIKDAPTLDLTDKGHALDKSSINGTMERELRLDERLDGMIDKCIKRLAQTKALKTVLPSRDTEPPRRMISHSITD